ncbi:MAG TPA: DUF2490 domain-containing protein [Sediminibacterium sp.]|nr:DUF2490 domain-containing protein [Sediminibacterium sp.]
MKFSKLLLLLLYLPAWAGAQSHPLTSSFQSWAGYYPQVRFSKHWGVWVDMELHSGDAYAGVSQSVFRLAGTWYNNRNNKFTAGYGHTQYYQGTGKVAVPEDFSWQQYQWYTRPGRSKIMQWLRLEQKWKRNTIADKELAPGSQFSWKLRYEIFATLPLSKRGLVPGSLAIALGNEIYLYDAPGQPNHFFDQNRVFTGFSLAVNSHDNLVFGCTHILQENSAANQFKYLNVLRLSFFENIRL